MFESPVKTRDLILFSFFSLIVLLAVFLSSFFDERTKIVFCNVGQGDAAYIRIKNKIDVLIDAGPDKSVLSCLGKYMPFWDRKIELAFLSHPNNDHYNGYFFIADRYKIDKFITVNTSGLIVSKTYKKLLQKISDKKIKIEEAVTGKIIQVRFDIFWPPKDFSSSNDNDYSSVILFNGVLFTGDASPFVLGRLSQSLRAIQESPLHNINVLKIPHHGSKNGLTKRFLDLADPSIAVISAGKNNSYGHPSKKVLDMLKAKNIKIRRTDIEGDIVFKLRK
ncbi:MAG: MBL fold metallo-hydrolase [Patescibacteria group bacterium]